MIALVRAVIARSTWSRSMLAVTGSQSTKTGVAPQCSTVLEVAMKVIGVVMTSSPGPTSRPFRARNNAVVAENSPTAPDTPR